MKKTIVSLVAVCGAFVGYMAWPLYDVYQLSRAITVGDTAAVEKRVKFSDVRRSLVRQLVGDVLPNASPLIQGGLATAIESSDPITKLLNPQTFIEMMRTGWPDAVIPSQAEYRLPSGVLSKAGIGTAWRIFLHSDYFFRRVDFIVPPDVPATQQFELRFQLTQWRWTLRSIGLPEPMRRSLAQEINRQRSQSKP